MEVTLVGVGLGNPTTLTAAAAAALQQADGLVGSRRLLEECPLPQSVPRKFSTKSAEIVEILKAQPWQNPCVLYSGDTGFYSGARTLIPLLEEARIPFQVLPGISSLQYFAARLGRSWQEWAVVSAHGLSCDPVGEVLSAHGKPVFFLTSGSEGAGSLCERLSQAGLGHLSATVGQSLSYPQEEILSDSVSHFAGRAFAPLTVLLVEGYTSCRPAGSQGLADELFLRGDVPMTKQEVRAAAIGKLAVRDGETYWDVGAGTGSVSVEIARVLGEGAVYAVEREPDALALIEQNRAKFGLWNLRPVAGSAPGVLGELPAPDAVFVGGSSGNLAEIVGAALEKNPGARIVVNAVTLETVTEALGCFGRLSLREPDAVQLSVSRVREAGHYHMMQAQNPVWVLSAGGSE